MAAPNGRTRPDLPRLVTGRRRWLLALLVANGVGQAATATATVLLVEATFERLLAGGPRGSVGALLPYAGGLVLTALAVGYGVFGDWPDLYAFLGIGLVVGSGLYTLHREQKRLRDTARAEASVAIAGEAL